MVKQEFITKNLSLNIADLSVGMYFLTINSGNKKIYSTKIIKQ
jgi:hypothetical protein